MAFTLIVKSNASQGTDVLIKDLGFLVPNSGGTVTFTLDREAKALQASKDLRTYLTDNAYGAGSSTLILNDGSGDLAQSDALNWLDTVILPDGDADYGVVKTNAVGKIDTDLTGDGTALLIDWKLGSNLNANNFEVTGLPLTPTGPTNAASKSYVDELFVQSRSWKEIMLAPSQFDSVNDALSQAIPFFLDANIADGDDFTITDGTTTETFTFLDTPAVAFDVQRGGSADATMANLVTAINTDSTLWAAATELALESINDGSGSSTAGTVVLIYRADQSATSFDDRIYGTFTTPADAQYVNYAGELDYAISTNSQVPAADPGVKTFGIGYATADLLSGQTHLNRDTDQIYTWDADAGQWNITGSALDYGLVGDIQSLGSSLAAGTSTRVSRADHVHTHGDRGGDGAGSQHDADQIDVEGTYAVVSPGGPVSAETAFSNIGTALSSAAKAGKWLQFGTNQKVPASGTLYLQGAGGVVTSSVGHRMLRAGAVKGASIQVDAADGSNDYNLSIRINGSQVATLALASGNVGNHSVAISQAYAAGDTLEAALIRSAGSTSSTFDDILVIIEVVDA